MKTKCNLVLLISSFILFSFPVVAKEFSSTNEAIELIELYTSEGCSSCPSADKWLAQLKSDPQLFKKFIPLSFHVDYWDYLGWKDRFAKKQYSNRQYQHKSKGNLSQVYTPGFVVNNEEWRNWRFAKLFHWPDNLNEIGVLMVNYQPGHQQLTVSFTPESAINDDQLLLNVAVLGMGLMNDIKSGENRGRQLKHDFVVLRLNQHLLNLTAESTQNWQVSLLPFPKQGQQKTALVVWLSNTQSQRVIQAAGSYL